jgi:hypothetical protein
VLSRLGKCGGSTLKKALTGNGLRSFLVARQA